MPHQATVSLCKNIALSLCLKLYKWFLYSFCHFPFISLCSWQYNWKLITAVLLSNSYLLWNHNVYTFPGNKNNLYGKFPLNLLVYTSFTPSKAWFCSCSICWVLQLNSVLFLFPWFLTALFWNFNPLIYTQLREIVTKRINCLLFFLLIPLLNCLDFLSGEPEARHSCWFIEYTCDSMECSLVETKVEMRAEQFSAAEWCMARLVELCQIAQLATSAIHLPGMWGEDSFFPSCICNWFKLTLKDHVIAIAS